MADDPIRILAPPASAQRLGTDLTRAPAARHGRRGPRGPRRRTGSARGVRRRRQRRKRGRNEWRRRGWRQRHPQPLHVGRVPLAGAARQVRQGDRHRLQLERRGDREAAGVGRHQRLRPHHPDRRLHPADGFRRSHRHPRHVEARELRQRRSDLPRPDVGSRQLVLGAEGLGLDRLDLRQHRDHRAARDLERLPRRC